MISTTERHNVIEERRGKECRRKGEKRKKMSIKALLIEGKNKRVGKLRRRRTTKQERWRKAKIRKEKDDKVKQYPLISP